MQNRISQGFTLIEMLLSIALITAITSVGVPIYQSFQSRNELDVASFTITQTLRRAQILSQSVEGDASWGVAIQDPKVILFKGSSFASRDATYDEESIALHSSTSSGLEEVVFTKFMGLPQVVGTITLTSNNQEVRSITINEKGSIEY